MARKGLMEGLPKNIPDLEESFPIFLLTKSTKISRDATMDVSKTSPEFMLHMDFSFFNVKSSVDLPQLLWLYILLIPTPLYLHTEANAYLLKS